MAKVDMPVPQATANNSKRLEVVHKGVLIITERRACVSIVLFSGFVRGEGFCSGIAIAALSKRVRLLLTQKKLRHEVGDAEKDASEGDVSAEKSRDS